MKSINRSLLLVVCILCFCNVNSQMDPVYSSRQDLILLNNNVGVTNGNTYQQVQNANIIQINQVGLGNYANLTVKSSNANLLVNQDGAKNYVDLYKNTNELLQTVNQTGTNNFISDFSLNFENQIIMDVNQNGDNLSLYNNGVNSISKNMKIIQTGNSGRVYIFNH